MILLLINRETPSIDNILTISNSVRAFNLQMLKDLISDHYAILMKVDSEAPLSNPNSPTD